MIGPLITPSTQSRNGADTSMTSRKINYMTAKKIGRPNQRWEHIVDAARQVEAVERAALTT